MISAVIITRDEERNIEDCIRSVRFCGEVLVVDSGSSDRTAERARGLGAEVLFNPFKDYASQKNFGIARARGEWVLLIDADERVSEALGREIQAAVRERCFEGYFLKRRNRIFGRWMRFGASGGDRQLRLVKKERARFEGPVHERIVLADPAGRRPADALVAGSLRNPLWHNSTETVSAYLKKLNTYTALEAEILRARGEDRAPEKMKRRPFLLPAYWLFWKGGVLDGLEGVLFAVLSAYYDFVRFAKCWELERKGAR
jgi:glycosyltransferase involved in cell wall biosynthesis